MADVVIVDGDQAMFLPVFGAALVVVQPGRISGSGPASATGLKACVDGDEGSVSVPGCMYIAAPHVIPGSGTLTIDALAGDQLATSCDTGGKPLILKGSQFTAKFSVAAPAMQPQPPPAPPTPDATPSYSGHGSFVTTNLTVKAS